MKYSVLGTDLLVCHLENTEVMQVLSDRRTTGYPHMHTVVKAVSEDIRPATKADFDRFRVASPPDFEEGQT